MGQRGVVVGALFCVRSKLWRALEVYEGLASTVSGFSGIVTVLGLVGGALGGDGVFFLMLVCHHTL
jgi:hypothetical protein